MRPVITAVALVLAGPAWAAAGWVACEGGCEDGFGSVMEVQNQCADVAERCVAGCDRSGPRPVPYAKCEPTGQAKAAAPANGAGDPGGVRVRDGQ